MVRYDDDTLIALVPDIGQIEAAEVCSRIGREIVMSGLAHGSSVRVGAATCPDDSGSFEELLQIARKASIDTVETMSDLAFLSIASQEIKPPS